jgi:hypothetical protein
MQKRFRRKRDAATQRFEMLADAAVAEDSRDTAVFG